MAVRRATLDDVKALRGFILRALEEAGPGALGWTGASEDAVSEIAGVEFLSSLLRRGASPSTSPSRRAPSSDSALSEMGGGSVELSDIVVLESMTGRGIGAGYCVRRGKGRGRRGTAGWSSGPRPSTRGPSSSTGGGASR